ncbi:hypothetical protein GW17_00012948 [Ensete ventricosum]|nr:hypothetical protein GW17_00012948 [Ensete ventricosum]
MNTLRVPPTESLLFKSASWGREAVQDSTGFFSLRLPRIDLGFPDPITFSTATGMKISRHRSSSTLLHRISMEEMYHYYALRYDMDEVNGLAEGSHGGRQADREISVVHIPP